MSDLIRREDAIEAVERCLKHLARPSYTVRTAIEAIPSVDVDISEYSDKLWRNAYERGKADRPQGEWHNGFYDFLWNVINPNEMQKYIEMYEAQPIAVDGAQMKGADDERDNEGCACGTCLSYMYPISSERSRR